MYSLATAALTLFAALPAYGLPSQSLTVTHVDGPVFADEYIVKLKSNANRGAHIARVQGDFSVSSSSILTTYRDSFFNAYHGVFKGEALDAILADSDVEYVIPNSEVSIFDSQTTAPWGLQAISTTTVSGRTDTGSLTFNYTYDPSAGEGVDVYIVDTGIYPDHVEFEGRAIFGFAAGTYAKRDGHGHGTHCAGTIGSAAYGVAKKATLYGVKVLSDGGSGSVADIASGLQWVVDNAATTGKPSVASLSLGGSASTALDDAVAATIAAGIPVAVAAGNSNVDAANTSPARVPTAVTVGASTIANAKASFSNYGPIVDIWGPGLNVISTWITSTTATSSLSGTSMATPHIAGLIAYLYGRDGYTSPADIQAFLKSTGTPDVLTGLPAGTVNLLAFNGAVSKDPEPTSSESTSSTATETSTSATDTSITETSAIETSTEAKVVTVTVTPTLTLTLTL